MKVKSGILISNSVFITETQRQLCTPLRSESLPSCLCARKQSENSIGLYKFELKVRGREKR